jgi:hypothetical protein
MEYQFLHNILSQPMAKCELECEPFGDWLTYDVAQDTGQITHLLEIVAQLQNKQIISYQHNSKEYHLIFDNDEVELILNNNHIQNMTPAEEDESQELSELQIQSGCGLADFYTLLKAWQQFIS